MVRADGNGRRPRPCPYGWLTLLDEPQHGNDPLLDLIAAVQIDLVRSADRVADVFLEKVERLVELPQQESFFGRLGIKQDDGVQVAVSHAEDVICLLHQLERERTAAVVGNV